MVSLLIESLTKILTTMCNWLVITISEEKHEALMHNLITHTG